MTSQEIRAAFLNFFKSKQHTVVQSAPMVLKNDPSLLFVNAGMVPFKDFFLGNSLPKNKRICNTQKCLRVSGKHNDLEEVGHDTYHHTLFEMLGNWSFGDYFKKQAISWAWELLTEVYNIDKNNLYVTVFEGSNDKDQLSLDKQSYSCWKKLVPEDQILMGAKKDNFWEMGQQGPCGPSSEIHIDIRPLEEKQKVDGASLINKDHPQVIEIWNLVFVEYNRKADGTLEDLPEKHIDTGMGFERLCMVLQNVISSYDTDIFKPLIHKVETITNIKYNQNEKTDIAIRVIVDHIRAVAFSIADGQLPSNTGAGYVIRRILRRAIRYGFTFLNQKNPFIYKLVDILSHQTELVFPQIKKQSIFIEKVIQQEEQSFLRTLDQGLLLLDTIMETTSGVSISGEKTFELYDTYGFPFDLTQLIAKEKGFLINETAFFSEMKKQKNRSRIASDIKISDWVTLFEQDTQQFVGYDSLDISVKITKYRKITTQKDGQHYQLIFNKTPFYPEGGGQVGDTGHLESANGNVIHIVDTKKENNVIMHLSKTLPNDLYGTFKAVVNTENRNLSACNHTATHLLHQALRNVLGTHVEQKGSLVNPKYLRFDFSHFSKVNSHQLQDIEDFVNARIGEHIPLQEKRNIPIKEAIDKGAMALFGETYGDRVRMIQFGKSIELCGGTHVSQTSDIWYFKIISEGAVGSGIRRIEAITNKALRSYFQTINEQYSKIKQVLKTPVEPLKAIVHLQDENTTLKKQVEQLLQEKTKYVVQEIKNKLQQINGVLFISTKIDLNPKEIKNLAFTLGKQYNNLFLVFGTSIQEKAILTCYISKELIQKRGYNASNIVKELGRFIDGGGGGQPFFATAGGKNSTGILNALDQAKKYIV